MADPFRAFPPRKGGDALWSDTGPAGTILRTGFFGAPAPSGGILDSQAVAVGSGVGFSPAAAIRSGAVAALAGSTAIAPLAMGGGGATGTLNLLEQNAGTTNIPDVVTGTITITAGRPVFAILVGVGDLATSGSPHSLSGAGQTWTQIYSAPVAGDDVDYARCSVWVSDAASGGSGVLTFSTPDQSAWAYAVVEFQPSSGATATIGTEVEATIAENATTNSVALGAADYWVALAGASKASGYGSLSATPRAGWTEAADSVALDTGWLAGVHVQLSPLGGDTNASMTWSQLVNIPLVAVPITLTGGGGGGSILNSPAIAVGLGLSAAVPAMLRSASAVAIAAGLAQAAPAAILGGPAAAAGQGAAAAPPALIRSASAVAVASGVAAASQAMVRSSLAVAAGGASAQAAAAAILSAPAVAVGGATSVAELTALSYLISVAVAIGGGSAEAAGIRIRGSAGAAVGGASAQAAAGLILQAAGVAAGTSSLSAAQALIRSAPAVAQALAQAAATPAMIRSGAAAAVGSGSVSAPAAMIRSGRGEASGIAILAGLGVLVQPELYAAGRLAFASDPPRRGEILNTAVRKGRVLNTAPRKGEILNQARRDGVILNPVRRGRIEELDQ